MFSPASTYSVVLIPHLSLWILLLRFVLKAVDVFQEYVTGPLLFLSLFHTHLIKYSLLWLLFLLCAKTKFTFPFLTPLASLLPLYYPAFTSKSTCLKPKLIYIPIKKCQDTNRNAQNEKEKWLTSIKCSKSLVIKEMQIKTKKAYHLHLSSCQILFKNYNTEYWQECKEMVTFTFCWQKSNLTKLFWNDIWQYVSKALKWCKYNPVISFLSIYFRLKMCDWYYICIYLTTLFI